RSCAALKRFVTIDVRVGGPSPRLTCPKSRRFPTVCLLLGEADAFCCKLARLRGNRSSASTRAGLLRATVGAHPTQRQDLARHRRRDASEGHQARAARPCAPQPPAPDRYSGQQRPTSALRARYAGGIWFALQCRATGVAEIAAPRWSASSFAHRVGCRPRALC